MTVVMRFEETFLHMLFAFYSTGKEGRLGTGNWKLRSSMSVMHRYVESRDRGVGAR
jgi:hypothetical protein